MPSRAEHATPPARIWMEHGLRAVAFAALAWLVLQSFARRQAGERHVLSVSSDSLTQLLAQIRADSPAALHLRVGGDVSPAQRDWLAALSATGTRISWSGERLLPVAAVTDPVSDPRGGARILAAAPNGAVVSLADQYGVLASVRAELGGGRFVVPWTPDALRVRAGALVARTAPRDSLLLRRVLVLGAVGWESKFVIAALEEAGWRVDARLALSPKGDVTSLAPAAIDTARYSAVIALDTSALRFAPQLARYASLGGGVVLAQALATKSALEELHAGAGGPPQDEVRPFATGVQAPRKQLALTPIALRGDAIALEYRDRAVAVAARRVQSGRVLVTGYEDTWRWRLAGSDDAVLQHRDWWVRLVGAVARVSRSSRAVANLDEAPLAHLVDALGPPATLTGALPIPRPTTALLFTVFAVAMLAECASRRLRGAR